MTKEQAIEILEKLLYAYRFIDYRFNNMLEVDETNAIQYILSDYKRVLKENEELLELKVCASAHNRILRLEKENKELKTRLDEINKINFPIIN